MSAQASAQGTTSMSRIAVAGLVGTTIEFYDFFIYGTAAALVFGKVFFPALGASAATVAAFVTLGWHSWRAVSAPSCSGTSATGSAVRRP